MSERRQIVIGGIFGEVFGFPVVSVEGPFADDYSKLKWIFKEHWSGESAEYRGAGYEAHVKDYDGDAAGWRVKRHGILVAEGDEREFFPALAAAEAAIRADVRKKMEGRSQ